MSHRKNPLKRRKPDHVRPNGELQPQRRSDSSQRVFALFQPCLIFLIYFAVGFIVFHKGFPGPMVYDSVGLLENKAQVYATHDLLRILSIAPARPLFTLTFYLNYVLTGMQSYYFRLLNLAILAGAGLALAWLIVILLEIPCLCMPGTSKEKRVIGLFLGLLFVVHPLQCYVVLYIWQREAIMACLFYFLSLAIYLGARSERFRMRRLAYPLTAGLFLAGLLSKENVATLPITMFLAELILFRQGLKQIFKRSLLIVSLTLPVLCVYFSVAYALHGPEATHARGMIERLITQYGYAGISPLQVMLTESRVFFAYLLMILAPLPQFLEFIKAQSISRSLLEPPVTIFAMAAICGLIATGVALLRKCPLVSFGIFFCIVVLIPESLFIPQYLFFGYRAILPMAGIKIIIAYLWVALAWSGLKLRTRPIRSVLWFAMACVLICMAAGSLTEAAKWGPLKFWKTPADRLPKYSEELEQWSYFDIVLNGMQELDRAGKYADAIDLFGKASSMSSDLVHDLSKIDSQSDRKTAFRIADENLSKNFPDQKDRTSAAWMDLGGTLAALGDKSGFESSLTKAIELKPDFSDAHFSLAEYYIAQNRLESAWDHMKNASDAAPSDPRFLNGLGKILVQQGKGSDAVPYFEKAIEAAPGFDDAYYNIGEAYVSMTMPKEAELNFRKALQLNAKNWKSHNSLGLVLAQSGNTAEAMSHFRTALSLTPSNWRIYNNLGVMMAKSGDYQGAAIQFQKSLEINPQDLSAKANLERLRRLIGSPASK